MRRRLRRAFLHRPSWVLTEDACVWPETSRMAVAVRTEIGRAHGDDDGNFPIDGHCTDDAVAHLNFLRRTAASPAMVRFAPPPSENRATGSARWLERAGICAMGPASDQRGIRHERHPPLHPHHPLRWSGSASRGLPSASRSPRPYAVTRIAGCGAKPKPKPARPQAETSAATQPGDPDLGRPQRPRAAGRAFFCGVGLGAAPRERYGSCARRRVPRGPDPGEGSRGPASPEAHRQQDRRQGHRAGAVRESQPRRADQRPSVVAGRRQPHRRARGSQRPGVAAPRPWGRRGARRRLGDGRQGGRRGGVGEAAADPAARQGAQR